MKYFGKKRLSLEEDEIAAKKVFDSRAWVMQAQVEVMAAMREVMPRVETVSSPGTRWFGSMISFGSESDHGQVIGNPLYDAMDGLYWLFAGTAAAGMPRRSE